MDEQRLERALREGPAFGTRYVARSLVLADELVTRPPASASRLVLIVAVTALLLVGMLAGLAALGALRDDDPRPLPERAPVLAGLDGQAFMDIMEVGAGPGLVCGDPQRITAVLQQWSCVETREYTWEVSLLGESVSAIHSINASVGTNYGSRPDSGRAAVFLGFVAESAAFAGAEFSGADPAAARDWVIRNEHTESIQLELPGVTYNLRGAEVRSLEIVATD